MSSFDQHIDNAREYDRLWREMATGKHIGKGTFPWPEGSWELIRWRQLEEIRIKRAAEYELRQESELKVRTQLTWLMTERDSRKSRCVPVPRWVTEGICELELMLGRSAEDARESRYVDDENDGSGPAAVPRWVSWCAIGTALIALVVSLSIYWRT